MAILERNDKNSVAYILLNSPDTLNSLSDEMLAALTKEFENLKNDPKIRAVVLEGAGKAFCAGHNLKEMTKGRKAEDGGKAYFLDLFKRCARMMMLIQKLPQPVIAKVHGIATAAGCQLVATCDLAIAEKSTKFGVNGVNIGLFCSTPMVALSRNITRKKAFEMLTTGDFISAEQAKTLGLINRVVEIENFDLETEKLAEQIASKLGVAVKIGKEAFYKQLEMPISEAYEYTGRVMAENMMFRQTEKGIDAFLNKREPTWEQD
ncbi:MAG: enoyl-CoA hydratase [Paracoccaceae bacterium]|jgi:enoyl-CoA hydratase/carnithine racemase|nr:enoyl-CoA hydratase [Paracoccaceae bacterium]NCV48789.1 enoyl-CoA hydratase [Rhodobacterales bacterium]NDA29285.1 enoyl-CoA hydratase [Alphaproteobacteria bacterium]MCH1562880.1 enoyl-CoA hydratase [Paracoccaceae bacterium]NCX54166.1 enoyl-CoA hydratase [Rhodobacterales bacterium]|tara:strand:+ start:928 stop:1716 length:789 start_codon:yes stop_codon:yes gene_type:complete